jgi:hypothetical protein
VLAGLFIVVDLARVGSHWVKPYNWKSRYVDAAANAVFDFLRQKPNEHRVAIWPFGLPGQLGIIQQLYGTEWLQHLFQYYNIQSLDIIQMPRTPQDVAAFEAAMVYDNTTNTLHRIVRRWELTNMRYLVGAAGLQDLLNQQIDAQGRFRVVQRFEIVPRSGILRPTKVEDFTVATATNGNFAVFEFTGALPRAKL